MAGAPPAELWRWDAADLAAAIRAGSISSRDAVAAALARLDAVNARVNAVVDIQAERALAAADAADAARRRGDTLGPLHGVPVTLKDLVDQAGIANVNGVTAFRTRIAAEDSPVVLNWRRAGAIVIGRTNTPGFSARWDTANAVYGRTWNPWARARTAGGSSGGAAAALAVGIGALAHGTDLGGSIRYPAYCCGVAGLRPTMGRVPNYATPKAGEFPLYASMIAVNGLLARKVRDLRLGFPPMCAGDARDPLWMPVPLEFPALPRPIRVALVTEADGLFIHDSVRASVRRAGAALADAGYLVEEVAPPGIGAIARLWAKLGAVDTSQLSWEAIRTLGDAEVARVNRLFLDTAPETPTLVDYLRALGGMIAHRRAWSLFMETYPIVVGPNSGDLPFPVGSDIVDVETTRHQFRAQALLSAVNLLGLPSVAVPTGTVAEAGAPLGLPVGVQVIANRFREDVALAAAEEIERRCPLATPIDPLG